MKRRGRGLRRRYGRAGAVAHLRSYAVEVDPGDGRRMDYAGHVMLPVDAGGVLVEKVLSRVGVYAPRGLDRLVWHRAGRVPAASIKDASGHVIVKLFEEKGFEQRVARRLARRA